MIKKVDIIGLGALGAMYAAIFTKALGKENVRILADAKRVERYKKDGISYNGELLDLNYCDVNNETQKSELLLFATKYDGLYPAMESVKHLVGDNTILISVLNGIVSEEDLGKVFGPEKVVYCIARKMDAVKEGNIATCMNQGELALGIANGGEQSRLNELDEFFNSIDFAHVVCPDILREEWSKLLCNVGVNQTVSYYQGTYSTIQQEGRARDMMIQAMKETVFVANAEGIKLSEADIDSWLTILDSLNPDGMPSMRQDDKAGRHTEIDLFGGTISALGKKHNIKTPVNDTFALAFKAKGVKMRGENVFIADGAKIYGNVAIGDNSSIWFNAVVRSEHNLIKIGKNTSIQDNCVVHTDPWNFVNIGDNVTIGHGAIIHGCTIGDNSLIGMGAIIMNDAVIGNNCIVGAGALVTEKSVIPDNSVVMGSPAKVKRTMSDEDASKLKKNAEHYVHIASEYMEGKYHEL